MREHWESGRIEAFSDGVFSNLTPDVKQRTFRWVTPGALVGVLVWLVASIGFSA